MYYYVISTVYLTYASCRLPCLVPAASVMSKLLCDFPVGSHGKDILVSTVLKWELAIKKKKIGIVLEKK